MGEESGVGHSLRLPGERSHYTTRRCRIAYCTSFTIVSASALRCNAVDKPPSTKQGQIKSVAENSVAVRCTPVRPGHATVLVWTPHSKRPLSGPQISHSYLYSSFTPPTNKYALTSVKFPQSYLPALPTHQLCHRHHI
jgi:hypothetical protein